MSSLTGLLISSVSMYIFETLASITNQESYSTCCIVQLLDSTFPPTPTIVAAGLTFRATFMCELSFVTA